MEKDCMESWKKYLPDYEIRLWNEANFDLSICKYAQEAYNAKKYAFVSDFCRIPKIRKQSQWQSQLQ